MTVNDWSEAVTVDETSTPATVEGNSGAAGAVAGHIHLDEQFASVLAAARAGADWAWERIYDDLAPTVLAYVRARGAPDAEAVCSELFAQLVRDIHTFDGDEAGFRSWVFVMAHHRLLDDVRRRRRRPEDLAPPEVLVDLVATSDVEAQVIRRAGERAILEMLDELTPLQRDVLLLRVFGGLPVEEVARAVGKRVGAVKALQRRGLEALKGKIEALSPEGQPGERGEHVPF